MRVEQFSNNLKGVALHIASQQGLTTADPLHVDQAHEMLARAGLNRTKWYLRSDFEVGMGSLLLGVALASPTLGPYFFERHANSATIALLAVGLVSGLLLSIHGWMRGGAPPVLAANERRQRLLCWPWSHCTPYNQRDDGN